MPLWFVNIVIEGGFILCWAEYYYRIMRRYPAALPLRFWLVILLPLYAGWLHPMVGAAGCAHILNSPS